MRRRWETARKSFRFQSRGTDIALWIVMVSRRGRRSARATLLLTGVCAAVFAFVTREVASRSARPFDERMRRRFLRWSSTAADQLSAAVTGLTSPPSLIASTLAIAFRVRNRGRHVWVPIAAAPFAAMLAGQSFTTFLPQQYAPRVPEPSFPSGHTTGATAEALTIVYVLRRQGAISRTTAAMITMLPVIGGINRLYRDRHWTTDIIAGWSAGAAIAAILGMMSDAAAVTAASSE